MTHKGSSSFSLEAEIQKSISDRGLKSVTWSVESEYQFWSQNCFLSFSLFLYLALLSLWPLLHESRTVIGLKEKKPPPPKKGQFNKTKFIPCLDRVNAFEASDHSAFKTLSLSPWLFYCQDCYTSECLPPLPVGCRTKNIFRCESVDAQLKICSIFWMINS